MAGKFIFKVDGSSFVITDDVDIRIENLRQLREELKFDKTQGGEYVFKLKSTGVVQSSPNSFAFANIIDDRTSLAFPTEADLNTFLSESIGFFFNPNPVDVEIVGSIGENVISVVNSTTALLGSGATFTGAWEEVVVYTTTAVTFVADTESDGVLYFDVSADGGLNFSSIPFTITNVVFAAPRIWNLVESHIRIRYVNGTTPQIGVFQLQTKHSIAQELGLASTLSSAIGVNSAAVLNRSVITGSDPDGVFHNVITTRNGNLDVSIADADTGSNTIVTPGGALKSASQTHLVGEPFGGSALNTIEWDIDLVGSGTQDATGAGELTMDTGITANSAVEIESSDLARFIPANYNTSHHAVTIPDGASYAADNSRKWGAFEATNAVGGNGIYFEIDDGDWFVAHCLNGVATRIAQVDWNGLGAGSFPTGSITANVYEVEYNAGSIIYRVNSNVIHRETLLALPYANDIHFPVGMNNTNYNGSTTDVSLKIRAASIYTLGKGLGQERPFYVSGTNGAGDIVKTGAGHLGRVILARTGNTGGDASISIYDALSATNQVGRLAIGGDGVEPVEYDFTFNIGLFVVITGSGTLGTTITFD